MQGSESFRLVVRRGPQPNQVYELTKDVITLGRDITNDIVINDPEASRHHLRLTKGVTGYNIEDLGSTNGTFIGGQRIAGVRELKRGDMIGLGETVTLGYEVIRAGGDAGAQPAASSPYARPDGSPSADPAPQAPSPEPQAPAPYGQQYGNTQDYGAPPPDQQYGQQPAQPYDQQGQYAPPQDYGQQAYAPQAPGYEYDPYQVREEEGGNSLRWILIGCGLLFVFCCCATTIGAVIIDAAELWDDIPIIRELEPTFASIAKALGFIN